MQMPVREQIRPPFHPQFCLQMRLFTNLTFLGIWTQVLLAYGVHKSLIFIRVPVTLAITPKIAKTLRSWGWNVGKPAVKPAVKST